MIQNNLCLIAEHSDFMKFMSNKFENNKDDLNINNVITDNPHIRNSDSNALKPFKLMAYFSRSSRGKNITISILLFFLGL